MTTLKRLSVVMSVFGAGLVVAACASPTDAEIAEQPAQQEDVDTTSSALVDEAEEAAEDVGEEAEETAQDVADTAEDVTDGDKEEGSVSQEQRYGYGRRPGGGYGHGRRCDYRDVYRCLRGHRGWRWVDLGAGRGYGRGGGYGYGRHGRPRSNYCCMRVLIRDHRGGPYGY